MRIKTNTLKSIRDFFDEELTLFYPNEEIRFYFYWCCEYFLNLSKTQILANLSFRISESVMLKFNFAVKDLKQKKPIQYILETCDFSGLSLHITSDVLIPRPETEEFVQNIIAEHSDFEGRILDLCTGSGCIALALKKRYSKATIHGLDISEKAIAVAKENAMKNRLEVDFFVADVYDDWVCSGKGCFDTTPPYFDVIVSNPPYVLISEKSQMQANVLDYEPHLALFVDDKEPLVFYHAIIDFAKKRLKSNGRLYFEINEKFGKQVSEILKEKGFHAITKNEDFRGKDRFISGTKN